MVPNQTLFVLTHHYYVTHGEISTKTILQYCGQYSTNKFNQNYLAWFGFFGDLFIKVFILECTKVNDGINAPCNPHGLMHHWITKIDRCRSVGPYRKVPVRSSFFALSAPFHWSVRHAIAHQWKCASKGVVVALLQGADVAATVNVRSSQGCHT